MALISSTITTVLPPVLTKVRVPRGQDHHFFDPTGPPKRPNLGPETGGRPRPGPGDPGPEPIVITGVEITPIPMDPVVPPF